MGYVLDSFASAPWTVVSGSVAHEEEGAADRWGMAVSITWHERRNDAGAVRLGLRRSWAGCNGILERAAGREGSARPHRAKESGAREGGRAGPA